MIPFGPLGHPRAPFSRARGGTCWKPTDKNRSGIGPESDRKSASRAPQATKGHQKPPKVTQTLKLVRRPDRKHLTRTCPPSERPRGQGRAKRSHVGKGLQARSISAETLAGMVEPGDRGGGVPGGTPRRARQRHALPQRGRAKIVWERTRSFTAVKVAEAAGPS